MFYTIGQNRDLNMGGNSDKYFVCEKDISTNTLWVVEKKFKDKYLTSTSCTVVEFNWINGFVPTNDEVQIRFRHRQPLINGRFSVKSDKVFLEYAPTLSVAKGQFAVLYQGNICLGGGIIKKLGITNH
jgi:tRNA-specific 2-thiouridylase